MNPEGPIERRISVGRLIDRELINRETEENRREVSEEDSPSRASLPESEEGNELSVILRNETLPEGPEDRYLAKRDKQNRPRSVGQFNTRILETNGKKKKKEAGQERERAGYKICPPRGRKSFQIAGRGSKLYRVSKRN